MRRLLLCSTKIKGVVIKHLGGMNRLESLNLGTNRLTDSSAAALPDSPWFRQLTALHLFGNPISATAWDTLRCHVGARQEFHGILG